MTNMYHLTLMSCLWFQQHTNSRFSFYSIWAAHSRHYTVILSSCTLCFHLERIWFMKVKWSKKWSRFAINQAHMCNSRYEIRSIRMAWWLQIKLGRSVSRLVQTIIISNLWKGKSLIHYLESRSRDALLWFTNPSLSGLMSSWSFEADELMWRHIWKHADGRQVRLSLSSLLLHIVTETNF